MSVEKIGLWFVGARGGVAATAAVGLAALRRHEAPLTGLVTQSPEFENCGLCSWDQWVVGGHEISSAPLKDSVLRLEAQQGAIPPGSATRYAEDLAVIDQKIRPGVLFRSGPAVDAIADAGHSRTAESPRAAIEAIEKDLLDFAESEQLARVVVVLLSSAEPPVNESVLPDTYAELDARLDDPASCPLRASSLYSIAALQNGMPVVNFTPSLGPCCHAIDELARSRGVPYAGSDGKTGETLLKSILAPMFAARRLDVMSWVSHNLLGNKDGKVLADPEHKQAKLANKGALLDELLDDQASGQSPQSLVSIESIESLGDWKTAWNHVHFQGFLGVPMSLQFTWQGCDSALAAPLVLDLTRLIELAARRGQAGAIVELGAFFKRPLGDGPLGLSEQMERLIHWARGDSASESS